MIFSAETFYANVENSMSAEYAHQLRDIMHGSMFIVVFVGAFVGGIIGAFLGRAVPDATSNVPNVAAPEPSNK